MKQFFKTLGYGLIMMFYASLCVVLVISFVALFIESLTAIGFSAVLLFLSSLFLLALAVSTLCLLGYIAMQSVKKESKNG